MKKRVVNGIVLGVTCAALCALVFSCGGSKAKELPTSWEWAVNGDEDSNGTSTIEMTEVTQDGKPAYKFAGYITNAYQYGFVNVKCHPDEATLESIKNATAISFRVLGDGERYAVKITTSDVTDFCYYEYAFETVDGVATTIIVPIDYFFQPPWGRQVGVMVNLDKAMFIEYQTTRNGSPGPYEFTLWDLRVWTGGVPTEKAIVGKVVKAAPAPVAAPKGVGGNLGAMELKLSDNFLYGEGYQATIGDKRLFNGHQIVPGETFTLKITYTASRDLENDLEVGLVDTTPQANYWKSLSWSDDAGIGMAAIPASKAGEKVSATLTFKTLGEATSADGMANALVFTTRGAGQKGMANSGEKKAVTLNFTEFVFAQE